MPRPNRAYGRPRSNPVIPAAWETDHAPVAQATMTATVNLRKPGASSTSFNVATQQTVPVPFAPYASGQPARFQAYRATAIDRAREVAEDTVRVTGYLVALPLQLNPDEGDQIDVTACSDADLVGRTLTVVDLVRGSLRFERDVFAMVND